jgi:hypothetical protein
MHGDELEGVEKHGGCGNLQGTKSLRNFSCWQFGPDFSVFSSAVEKLKN